MREIILKGMSVQVFVRCLWHLLKYWEDNSVCEQEAEKADSFLNRLNCEEMRNSMIINLPT